MAWSFLLHEIEAIYKVYSSDIRYALAPWHGVQWRDWVHRTRYPYVYVYVPTPRARGMRMNQICGRGVIDQL